MQAPNLTALDHFVLTVADIGETVAFYTTALGMQAEIFHPSDGSVRTALSFGAQKINLHPAEAPFDPKAAHPAPGSADFCLLSDHPIANWQRHLSSVGISIEQGPVARTGARGPITSIYLRDPDGNLVEIATYG